MLPLLIKHYLISFLQGIKHCKEQGYFQWLIYGVVFLVLLNNGLHITLEIGKPESGQESTIVDNSNQALNENTGTAKALLASNVEDFRESTATGLNRNYKSYVNRYAKIAKQEMLIYGVPASIKLAQALIESEAGNSRLAKKSNNHFGIKCFSKKCSKGHCTNFSDDSHKDFFRKFDSVWASYRAHSEFLKKDRYQHLHKLSKQDYKAWAKGLSKAGYATDPKYAQKLVRIIERYELHKYDKI